MKAPILKGERIMLRPIKLSDASNYVKWFRDREVMRYLNQSYLDVSLEEERKAIRKLQRKKNDMTFVIIDENGKHIGGTSITLVPEHKQAHFGIVIGDKTSWGKGYAGECIKVLGDYVFSKLKYERFELLVFIPNKKAIQAYTKAGFVKEGVMRRNWWNKIDKKYEDNMWMSILKDEWFKKYKKNLLPCKGKKKIARDFNPWNKCNSITNHVVVADKKVWEIHITILYTM